MQSRQIAVPGGIDLQMATPGGAAERVRLLGRRYAIGIRIITLVPVGAVAILAADTPDIRSTTIVAVALVSGWSALYVALLARREAVWPALLDTAVMCCAAVIAARLTPIDWLTSGRSWIKPLVTFAAVGYQYSTPWRVGIPLGLAVCTTSAVAATMAQPGSLGLDAAVTAVWSNVIPLLARLLFDLVQRAARRADATFADTEAARREQTVAESVRTHERLIGDSLHDTAATTLLMVALGQATGMDEILRRRARHDLDTLRMLKEGVRHAPVDLCRELRATVRRAVVSVELRGPETLDVPSRVASALAEATGEALANVAKHAGAQEASVDYGIAGPGTVFVEIVDHGGGFDVGHIPPTSRGLRGSITDRVRTVGGSASVTSTAGTGTTVRLTWPS